MTGISTLHAARMLVTQNLSSPTKFPLGKFGNTTFSVAEGGSPRAERNSIFAKAVIRLATLIALARSPAARSCAGLTRFLGAKEKQDRLCASMLGQLSGDFTAKAYSMRKMQRTLEKLITYSPSRHSTPEQKREEIKTALNRLIGYTTQADRTAILATLGNMNWEGLFHHLGSNVDILHSVKAIIESRKEEAAHNSNTRGG